MDCSVLLPRLLSKNMRASKELDSVPAKPGEGLSIMADDADIDPDRFKALLLQRRDHLLSVAETGEEAAQPIELDQARMGRLSRMDALQGQAMSLETKRRRESALQRIAAALHRIEEGDYGYCLDCGEAISSRRLEVDPAAPLCIQCASKSETGG